MNSQKSSIRGGCGNIQRITKTIICLHWNINCEIILISWSITSLSWVPTKALWCINHTRWVQFWYYINSKCTFLSRWFVWKYFSSSVRTMNVCRLRLQHPGDWLTIYCWIHICTYIFPLEVSRFLHAMCCTLLTLIDKVQVQPHYFLWIKNTFMWDKFKWRRTTCRTCFFDNKILQRSLKWKNRDICNGTGKLHRCSNYRFGSRKPWRIWQLRFPHLHLFPFGEREQITDIVWLDRR